MKSNYFKVFAAGLLFTALLGAAGSVKSQSLALASIVPDSVGVYGIPMKVDMLGNPMTFRLKVIKHFGTTCVFNVEIENNGTKTLTATMGFIANDGQMYPATSGKISIRPGEKFYWMREKREVLKRGVKNDALACKNANPTLGFADLKVR